MNKQLAKKGMTLNKNMPSTESLKRDNLTKVRGFALSGYIKTESILCVGLDIPTNQPDVPLCASIHYDITLNRLYIRDDDDEWNYVTHTNIPNNP